MLTRADKILIGLVIILSVCGIVFKPIFISPDIGQVVLIYQDGKLIHSQPLNASKVIRVGKVKNYNVIEIKEGRVRVIETDCADKICLNTGFISRASQQIVCLPHRLVVKISTFETNSVDDIVR